MLYGWAWEKGPKFSLLLLRELECPILYYPSVFFITNFLGVGNAFQIKKIKR